MRVVDVGSFGTWVTCAVGRTFYYQIGGLTVSEPIPGTARVVATGGSPAEVMLENGDVYTYAGDPAGGGPWQFAGNMLGAPTPVEQTSFGSLKARYRGEREPQGVTPSTGR